MPKPTFQGSNINLVKEHNQRAILLSLLYEGPLSRIQLAKKLSLSATTITNLVDELLEQGILNECESQTSLEGRGVGRPRSAICLVNDSRYAIGVHMRVGIFRVTILDLLGHVVSFREKEFSSDSPARTVMEDIASTIEEIIANCGIERSKILGVGVGASGLVDYRSGVNLLASNFGWRDVPMREWLHDLLQLPVVIDNNVRCMALGEAMFGAGRGIKSLAFIYGRFGVGAGIVVDGKVFRGSGLGAGEIGHTIILPQFGPLCRCGQHGCLEPLVSEPSLVYQAEMAADQHPNSLLALTMRDTSIKRPIKRLFVAAKEGDPWARQLIETSADYLGIALANLVNLINPEMIILGGLFAEEQETILPIAREAMREHAFGGLGEKVRIQATAFGWQAGMIGAAALALAKFFYLNPKEV